MTRQAPKTLRWRLFVRDGWVTDGVYPVGHVQAGNKVRLAHCAFLCGTVLTYDEATVDHHPLPWRLGGTWAENNTRLACGPCNHHEAQKASNLINKAGMPQGLEPNQRRQWWINYVVEHNIKSELDLMIGAIGITVPSKAVRMPMNYAYHVSKPIKANKPKKRGQLTRSIGQEVIWHNSNGRFRYDVNGIPRDRI